MPSNLRGEPAVALRVQASVAPLEPLGELQGEPQAAPDDAKQAALQHKPGSADQPIAAHDAAPSPAPTPLAGGPRKSLTERARELGYEGDAWMALVYRLTGKHEPCDLTSQDKAKLVAYLGHLAKLAARPTLVPEHGEQERGEQERGEDVSAPPQDGARSSAIHSDGRRSQRRDAREYARGA